MQPSHLATPLATIEQLETSGSQLDGIPADLEDSVRFAGARLTQAAGILLRLPQEIVAQAIVVFTRFFLGPEGGSLAEYDTKNISASSLYIIAKMSAWPKSPRNVINVYTYLDSLSSTFIDIEELERKHDAEEYYVSEGTFQSQKAQLFAIEPHILRVLGFQLHVSLPYTLCITYLQALDVFNQPRASELAKRAIARLNDALLSPQLLYLTHQSPCLATAAIYLAAKEVGVKLPDVEWWEVFDTDREELGFLVVGMLSVANFALEEKGKWGKRKVPMTVEELEVELESRRASNSEE
ncbi:uncharacterized protein BDR25DRAFT_282468 [Lindgomyces ingoldianus]|uniref:Uncharacterized protein n=1 Tax=Lindgomyces ingoldianus TaxID=673940 RepID=A0ACB6R1V6_9PLEO|nr:uncharacterized protein BDR25DRAFT_282468 [Lindgomyces ingoldianus]KAF2473161.1 hypothetical protein BDR25DRAFT_282468 [Lindgomyces ingoldianus]